MVAAPALSYALKSAQGAPAAPRIEFASLDGWSGPVPADGSSWEPVFVRADALAQKEYRDSAGAAIEALGVAYATQRQGAELIGETSSVTGQNGLETAEQQIRTAAGWFRETTVTERSGRKWLIWSRYEIAGRAFMVPLAAQLWYGVSSLATAPLAGLVALRSQCLPDCAAVRGGASRAWPCTCPCDSPTSGARMLRLHRGKAALPDERASDASVRLYTYKGARGNVGTLVVAIGSGVRNGDRLSASERC
jgi:Protein of unknown function (DUF3485)